jgi:hypothetical protein
MATDKPKNIFKKLVIKGEYSLKDFWHKTKQEAHETQEAEHVLAHMIEGKKVTKEEKKALENQSIDILKVIFIGIPFAIIPGFSIIMIILFKVGRKYNVNFLPSAFAPPKQGT